MEILNPMSGFLVWGTNIGTGNPRESDLEGQLDLIIILPQDWGKQRLQSLSENIKLCMHQDSEERSSDPIGD